MKTRVGGLDFLRVIAIFGIAFMYHFYIGFGVVPTGTVLAEALCRDGWLGVEIFFAVSGFVIAYNYRDKIMSGELGFSEFLIKRVKKLAPLVVLTTLVYFFINKDGIQNGTFNLVYLLLNVFAVQASFFSDPVTSGQALNQPLWFVSVALLCYILFYAAAHCSKTNRIVLCSILLVLVGARLVFAVPGNNNWPLLNYQTGRGYMTFFEGVLFAQFYEWSKDRVSDKKIILTLFGISMIAVLGIVLNPSVDMTFNLIITFNFYFLPLIFAVSLYSKWWCRLFENKAVHFLSDISFDIFAWNYPVMILMYGLTSKFNIPGGYFCAQYRNYSCSGCNFAYLPTSE